MTSREAPRSYRVTAHAGGFELAAPAVGTTIRVRPEGHGFQVDGKPTLAGFRLDRATPGRPGFVLHAADGGEAGRTTTLEEERAGNLFYLLMGDGRMFRIGQRGARGERFELRSWEAGGAYLAAIPEVAGWRIEATPAGAHLVEPDPVIVLFAAVVLDGEEPPVLHRGSDVSSRR